MKLPSYTKKYFWDVDFSELSFQDNSGYVTARILEYGDVMALKWLFRVSKKKDIKKILEKSRQLSPKSCNFWSIFLNTDPNKTKCLKKSYQKMQKSHWPT